jgi:hypothetical protein
MNWFKKAEVLVADPTAQKLLNEVLVSDPLSFLVGCAIKTVGVFQVPAESEMIKFGIKVVDFRVPLPKENEYFLTKNQKIDNTGLDRVDVGIWGGRRFILEKA